MSYSPDYFREQPRSDGTFYFGFPVQVEPLDKHTLEVVLHVEKDWEVRSTDVYCYGDGVVYQAIARDPFNKRRIIVGPTVTVMEVREQYAQAIHDGRLADISIQTSIEAVNRIHHVFEPLGIEIVQKA